MAWSSTNLVNLRLHSIGSLVSSAFFAEDHVLDWIALAMIALVTAGRILGNVRAALLVTLAHVLGSLFSEAVLAYRIDLGAQPPSDRLIIDVGPSYVIVPALVVGIVYGKWVARIICGIAFALLWPDLFAGLGSLGVSAVGHCCTIAIALVLGYPLRRSWAAVRQRPTG